MAGNRVETSFYGVWLLCCTPPHPHMDNYMLFKALPSFQDCLPHPSDTPTPTKPSKDTTHYLIKIKNNLLNA